MMGCLGGHTVVDDVRSCGSPDATWPECGIKSLPNFCSCASRHGDEVWSPAKVCRTVVEEIEHR
jgi:hypothetical protein